MAERQLSKFEKKRERNNFHPVHVGSKTRNAQERLETRPSTHYATCQARCIGPLWLGRNTRHTTPGLHKPPTESLQRAQSIMLSSPPGSSLPVSSDHEDDYWSAGDDIIVDQSGDEQDELWDLGLDKYSTETDDSSSSMQCRLANGLISKTTIAGTIPVQLNSLALVPVVNYGQVQSPTSPVSETDSSTNNCVTRNASLAGASFLEWLFPLLVPNSSYSDNVYFLEKDPQESDVIGTKFLHESNCSQVGRPLLTLGELIVMSRRRNYQRKNIKMQKQPYMDFTKSSVFSCFGSGNNISGLHRKWKRQLQQKLV